MGIDIIDPSIIGTSINQPSSSDNTIEKPIEFNGRALVANKSHHIEFIGNTIKNAPSAAIRAQQSDYITITKNKVYDNTFWTTQGVGAITISEATVRPLGDTYTGTKIIITENEVYQNENRLFSWNPTKTFVHFEIDEGTGLFLTRNKDTYAHGEMLIANNLSYKNGASGIVCHHTNNVTIEHNTVFDNATTNHGNPGGIGVNISDNVKILSNISYSKSNKWALGILAEPVTNLVLDYNIVFNNSGSINFIRSTSSNPLTNGWSEMNPLFTDENNYDFSLSNSSAAINNASTQSGQTTDYFGNNRDANPDIGAIEHISTLGIDNPPGNGYNSPGDGYSSPDYGYTSPSDGYTSPDSGYSSPGFGYSSPGSGYSTPGATYQPSKAYVSTRSSQSNQTGFILSGELHQVSNSETYNLTVGFLISQKIDFNTSDSSTQKIIAQFETNNLFTANYSHSSFQTLYFKAFAENESGTSYGNIQKIEIKQTNSVENQTPAEKALSALAADSTELNGGWNQSTWFGLYKSYENGWIYHINHGWLFLSADSHDGIWTWSQNRGWTWSKEAIYPFIYQSNIGNWIYYLTNRNGQPIYFNYSNSSLEGIDP